MAPRALRGVALQRLPFRGIEPRGQRHRRVDTLLERLRHRGDIVAQHLLVDADRCFDLAGGQPIGGRPQPWTQRHHHRAGVASDAFVELHDHAAQYPGHISADLLGHLFERLDRSLHLGRIGCLRDKLLPHREQRFTVRHANRLGVHLTQLGT